MAVTVVVVVVVGLICVVDVGDGLVRVAGRGGRSGYSVSQLLDWGIGESVRCEEVFVVVSIGVLFVVVIDGDVGVVMGGRRHVHDVHVGQWGVVDRPGDRGGLLAGVEVGGLDANVAVVCVVGCGSELLGGAVGGIGGISCFVGLHHVVGCVRRRVEAGRGGLGCVAGKMGASRRVREAEQRKEITTGKGGGGAQWALPLRTIQFGGRRRCVATGDYAVFEACQVSRGATNRAGT